MEAKTKKILTIVGVVALVVVGYNYFSKDDEATEIKSGFLGFSPRKKAPIPVNVTLGNHCDCRTGQQYTVTSSNGQGHWTGVSCRCNNSKA